MIVTIEDRRFWYHPGFDIIAIFRAAWCNLKAGKIVQGGSTITQQLVRNVFLTNEKTFSRKFRELWLAMGLEQHASKATILELYIDLVYIGPKCKGFHAAAALYFQKSIDQCDSSELASLVAMLKGPRLYAPGSKLGDARRDLILRRLKEADKTNHPHM